MPKMTKAQHIRYELDTFIYSAVQRRLDLRGDALRFFSLKTARSWTAWIKETGLIA